jgi:hypothetical protein
VKLRHEEQYTRTPSPHPNPSYANTNNEQKDEKEYAKRAFQGVTCNV